MKKVNQKDGKVLNQKTDTKECVLCQRKFSSNYLNTLFCKICGHESESESLTHSMLYLKLSQINDFQETM